MRTTTSIALIAWTWFTCGPTAGVRAQTPAATICRPAANQVPVAAAAAGVQGQRPARPAARVPRDAVVTAIAGVVAAGASWQRIWQGAGNSADGILADRDGNTLVAQEDFDAVLRVDPRGMTSIAAAGAKGVGSLSMDREGRLYGAHRTERPGSTKPDIASIVNAITVLTPERRIVADTWTDGTPLTVRPNDLAADSRGGVYFTSGCLYYATSGGVSVVAEDLRTNGIIFNADDTTLYVTNAGTQQPGTILAFDVIGPGRLANRRVFATLSSGNGDGLALDADGRLYVTSNPGVQVFDRAGQYLGVIPTPRPVISAAFAGPGKRTLFVVGSGAEDERGQPIRQGPQQTAATIYTLPMLARGLDSRAK